MNREKREILRCAVSLIHDAAGKIRSVEFSEQDAMDNMPENLQYSDRYAAMESAVDSLEEAEQKLEEAYDAVMEAISS